MSFTQYKWGISKPYRNIWPILGFSSLRSDYARIVQINNFLIKVTNFIVTKVRSFDSKVNFSHIIIKNYNINFYNKPIFSIELFFWIKNLKDFFIKRKKLKRSKKRRKYFKKNKKKLFKIKGKIFIFKKFGILNRKPILSSMLLQLRRRKKSKVIKFVRKLKKKKKSIAKLKFRSIINRALKRKLRKFKIKKKRRYKKLTFKRYKYSRKKRFKRVRFFKFLVFKRKSLKRVKRTRLLGVKRFKFKFKIQKLFRLLVRAVNAIQKIRLLTFLNLIQDSFKKLKLNIIVLARLLGLGSGSVYLYLNHFTKKASLKKETNPKKLVKTFIKKLKKAKKKLRIKGALVKARGRFTRKDRAPKFKMKFGVVSTGTLKSRIEYAHKEFIFRFGVASIKLIVNYAR